MQRRCVIRFKVAIDGAARPFEAAADDTILAAALAQGVSWPQGCRTGRCGVCKSRLLDGQVEHRAHAAPTLTGAERADGLILPCRAMPRSDLCVALPEPEPPVAHPVRRLACRVSGIADLTHDIRLVRLTVGAGGPFVFAAGQYAAVTFEGHAPRDYSMANRPDECELEFHIRNMGAGASAHVATRLRRGDAVTVEGPHGVSYLRKGHRGPILAIAGGSGLAPMKAIVETALAHALPQPIRLYFGARDARDLYLVEHFRALEARHGNFRFIPVLSGPTPCRTGEVGAVAAADFDDLDGCKAYLAGPPAMVEATTPLLLARALRPDDIHADAFYSDAEKPTVAAAP